MTYAPPKAKRAYIGALWRRKPDGTRGALVTHKCYRCSCSFDSEKGGIWYEQASASRMWSWVCPVCTGYPADIPQKLHRNPAVIAAATGET